MPGDTEADTLNEANFLGEVSFSTFWAGYGLKTLMTMVDREPEMLEYVRIKTDLSDKTLNVEQFLTAIKRLKVRM